MSYRACAMCNAFHLSTHEHFQTTKQGEAVSANNGVIRIGRKGIKKFAFGEDGKPFDVDVVVAFQGWLCIDDEFRERDGCVDRTIKTMDMPEYHRVAVEYVQQLAYDPLGNGLDAHSRPIQSEPPQLTVAEALEFISLLREEYDALLTFFRPKSQDVPDSPDTSEGGLRFSEEPA